MEGSVPGPVGAVSDDAAPAEVVEEIRRRLEAAGYRPLKSLRCEFRHGEVVLQGTVPTYHLKQMAQELSKRSPLVDRVTNLIRVSAAAWQA